MILTFIVAVFTKIVTTIFGYLPTASLSSIPSIGPAIATTLTSATLTWNAFMVTFPYALDVWHVFFYAIIPFELAVLVLKLILGSRSPVH